MSLAERVELMIADTYRGRGCNAVRAPHLAQTRQPQHDHSNSMRDIWHAWSRFCSSCRSREAARMELMLSSFAVPGDVSCMAAVRFRACDGCQGNLYALGSAWLARAVQRHVDFAVQAISLRQHLCLSWQIRQLFRVVMDPSSLGIRSNRSSKPHKQQADGSLSVRRSSQEPELCSEPFLRHQITCTLAATAFWIFLPG